MTTEHYRPGAEVPESGIYWCTVCKLPAAFQKGDTFPACRNKCSRGLWELVEPKPPKPVA